jgi:hypothetical protein
MRSGLGLLKHRGKGVLSMDWTSLIPIGTGGIGGIIGYWIKAKIDDRREERSWKKKYYLEDLRRQRELLLEFLGTPRADFTMLYGVGDTWDETWRREKAGTVQKWVEQYRPLFPKDIQRALTRLANMAGSMVIEGSGGDELARRLEGFEAAGDAIKIIEGYFVKITTELMEV